MKDKLDTNYFYAKYCSAVLALLCFISLCLSSLVLLVLPKDEEYFGAIAVIILLINLCAFFTATYFISEKTERFYIKKEDLGRFQEHVDYLRKNRYFKKVNVVCGVRPGKIVRLLDFVIFDDKTMIVHTKNFDRHSGYDEPYILDTSEFYSRVIINNDKVFKFFLVSKTDRRSSDLFTIYKVKQGYLAKTQFRDNEDAVDNIINLVDSFEKLERRRTKVHSN